MKKILVSDITLRGEEFSFKEKIEVAKLLEKLNVDIIEVPMIVNERIDTLFLHTIAPIIKKSAIACPVELTKEAIDKTKEALKNAVHPIIKICVPTSTVQMEYICHKKPNKVLEMIGELVSYASEGGYEVEFSALDATRSEMDFLKNAIGKAVEFGAKTVTLCDTAGLFLPTEFGEFVQDIAAIIPDGVKLSCECSNNLEVALSSSMTSIKAGATEIKSVIFGDLAPQLKALAKIISTKGDVMGIQTGLNYAILNHSIDKLLKITGSEKINVETDDSYSKFDSLDNNSDITAVATAVAKLGYDLSDEDMAKVFEEFKKVSTKKQIGAKELDAIVASAALLVPPTYKLKTYVINNGNIISATANIEMLKAGELVTGVAIGDGPIDAAFKAIEQIIGYHFELDDFQIQAVTEGKEAVGSAVVKLRSNGKLYSGMGISTDIIGAGINAYVNAVNKIFFEEA